MPDFSVVLQPFIKLDTLERQLASIRRCPEKASVRLVLFSDNARGTGDDYVLKNERVMDSMTEFRSNHGAEFGDVIIHRTDENLGPYATCERAIDFALGFSDFVVFSEDDTLFARDALTWFKRMYESGFLERAENWAIAGESIYFDARDKEPSPEDIERAMAVCIERDYYHQFVPFDFIPSTCFATTRAKWKFFGNERGQPLGDTAVARLCAQQRKCCIFPVVPRVKDIGMLHADGHSVRHLGAEQTREREPKNTYLMSEDLPESATLGDEFRPCVDDLGSLYRWSVLLQPLDAAPLTNGPFQAHPALEDLAAAHERAQALLRAGERQKAYELLRAIVDVSPDFPGAHDLLAWLLLPGPSHMDVLACIHRLLCPATYLQIGVESGSTLSLATTTSIAVGVDPALPPLQHSFPAGTKLYNAESDAFFERESREGVFGDHGVDLVFVDGMHLFECALRDFTNSERWASRNSTILLHDCLPVSSVAAERQCRSTLWVGDVWKLLDCLRDYRPDLSVRIVPTAPSGLAVVRGLDPSSNVLSEKMTEILPRYQNDGRPPDPSTWATRYRLVDNTEAGVREALGL